jgi:transcriptional regulator with XRE-family HTH domain
MALREKLPLREIARRTGMSRNTIKKYLNADTIEPQFMTPDRQSKLDPFAEKLAGWLKTEAAKSRKQRRTCKQLHADLVVLGFDGSYGRVAAFARDWRTDRQREQQTTGRGTFVPLSFRPGEAFQFDWPIPVILGFCRAGRRAHEAASCPHQAVAQPSLPGPCVSAANACPSRDISCGNALPVNGCCSMRIGTGSGSLAVSRSVGFTTVRLGRHRFEARPNEDRC